MGKKKDKSSKSKKKSEAAAVIEAETEVGVEPETESIQYAEQVTAADVMELINTLSQDLNRLDESNQLLQQQVAQSQKAQQPQNTILKIITIILAIGIVTVGYSSVKINSRTNENTGTGIDSAGMDKMTSRITTMDTSIQSMTSDIDNINAGLGKLTADITTLNQNVNKVASDVSKINTSTASQPQHNQYMARPMEPWPRW